MFKFAVLLFSLKYLRRFSQKFRVAYIYLHTKKKSIRALHFRFVDIRCNTAFTNLLVFQFEQLICFTVKHTTNYA